MRAAAASRRAEGRQMTSEDKDALQQSLTGYKEKIDTTSKVSLTWDKDLIFVGRTERGHEIEFDAQDQWGCKPIEALLLSLAGCMGIDVVMFLQKMRIEVSGFKIDLAGERNPSPPQYYKTIEMVLRVKAKNCTSQKLERAVSLSQEKYCSVYNSLRKDLEVKVRYVLEE
jgi:putative redox protein